MRRGTARSPTRARRPPRPESTAKRPLAHQLSFIRQRARAHARRARRRTRTRSTRPQACPCGPRTRRCPRTGGARASERSRRARRAEGSCPPAARRAPVLRARARRARSRLYRLVGVSLRVTETGWRGGSTDRLAAGLLAVSALVRLQRTLAAMGAAKGGDAARPASVDIRDRAREVDRRPVAEKRAEDERAVRQPQVRIFRARRRREAAHLFSSCTRQGRVDAGAPAVGPLACAQEAEHARPVERAEVVAQDREREEGRVRHDEMRRVAGRCGLRRSGLRAGGARWSAP
jgi:hypothetical protein